MIHPNLFRDILSFFLFFVFFNRFIFGLTLIILLSSEFWETSEPKRLHNILNPFSKSCFELVNPLIKVKL